MARTSDGIQVVSNPSLVKRIEDIYFKIFRRKLSETQLLLAFGVIVGLGAGVGAVVFRELIAFFTHFFFKDMLPFFHTQFGFGKYAVILIPAIGGLIFGPLIYIFAREAKGHGVPEVMLAVAQKGGKIRPVVAVVKSIASAVCIGSGGSVGREGPIVQIGSALGSTLGQWFKMSESRIRMLVACGAAGGIAATFNAPIAGAFFALEVILNEFSTSAFGAVVISSVTASVIGRLAFGNTPAFPLPSYVTPSPQELPFYILFGVLCAFAGVYFSKILYWFEDSFDKIKIPEYLKPVPGGLMLGALGLFLPQIFGVGYPSMSLALAGHFALGLLLILTVAKILAVSLTLGSGGSGGVFAPSLFVGAMFGEAFGLILQHFMPGVITHPANFGLVGMAAVFTGAARAPITGIIILFELTGDYAIILPLMAAVVVATFVANGLMKESIYTMKLKRRGIDLNAGKSDELMRRLRVREAMDTNIVIAPESMTINAAAKKLKASPQHALLVTGKNGDLLGMLTSEELEEAIINSPSSNRIGSMVTKFTDVVHDDDTLHQAVGQMSASDTKVLPVFEREGEVSEPVGLLSRDNIFEAYSVAAAQQ